jgi:hypothetical protein
LDPPVVENCYSFLAPCALLFRHIVIVPKCGYGGGHPQAKEYYTFRGERKTMSISKA